MSVVQAPTVVRDIHAQNVIIGDRNIQITGDGCRVSIIDPRSLPSPKPLPRPLRVKPRAPEPFVNRDSELRELRDLTRTPRLVEIVGPPGVGKTWLARCLAQEDCEEMPDGVVYFLSPLRGLPLEDVVRDLFDHFYERFSSPEINYLPTRGELARGLQGLRALVLLDDVDMDEAAARALMDYLGSSSVVCTRSEQCLSEARVIHLGPIPGEHLPPLAAQVLGRALNEAEASFLSKDESTATVDIRKLLSRLRGLHDAAPADREQSSAEPTRISQFIQQPTLLGFVGFAIMEILSVIGGNWMSLESLVTLCSSRGDSEVRIDRPLVLARVADFLRLGAVVEDLGTSPDGSPTTSRLRMERDALRAISQAYGGRGEGFFRSIVAELLDYFSTHPARAASDDRPALLHVLRSATGSTLERRAMQCARAVEPELVVQGAFGSWSEVLERHGRAAAALGDTEQQAWNAHEQGVRALCLDDLPRARIELRRAQRLRRTTGSGPGRQLTRDALRLVRPGWVRLMPFALAPIVVAVGAFFIPHSHSVRLPPSASIPTRTTPQPEPTPQPDPKPPSTDSPPVATSSRSSTSPAPFTIQPTADPANTPASEFDADRKCYGAWITLHINVSPLLTKLDSVRWTIGKSTIDGPEAKVFLCSDVYTIMVEATQASRKRTSKVVVQIASAPPPTPSFSKPAFGIKPSANPGRVKASANPVSDGKQSCYGAWVTLGLSVLPPETKLKSVRWTVGKSTIDGPEAKVLLCSTSKDKPDLYTIPVEAMDEAGQSRTSSVQVEIDPDIPE